MKIITINIVAQSGHAWTEQCNGVANAKQRAREIVKEHGDIERVELLDKNGLNPKNIYRRK